MALTLYTAWGEAHGLINQLGNSVKNDNFQRFAPEHRESMRKLKQEESEIVRARYINHRGMHERLTKPYCRWDGDPIQIWHLIPGQEYELPMGFINEVNSSGLNIRSKEETAVGVSGMKDSRSTQKVESKEKLHELVPVSFISKFQEAIVPTKAQEKKIKSE